ncbi:MAG: hypothetical protein JXR83_02590 [Deltaproteobacteria bacterium]|nr:hypothetical protein [Deltaproteobacteria bacterium]
MMTRFQRAAGTTIIEMMIAITVSGLISAAAFIFFVRQTRYGRTVSEQTDTVDRSRIARQIITQDILLAGYGWEHEGTWDENGDGTGDVVRTGCFGEAGRGLSVAATWPMRPVTGVDTGSGPGADTLHLIVPVGKIMGMNGMADNVDYRCYQTNSEKAVDPDTGNPGTGVMTLTATGVSWPSGPAPTGWTSGNIVVLTGGGTTFVTTLLNVAQGNGGITVRSLVDSGGGQTCLSLACGGCAAGGAAPDPKDADSSSLLWPEPLSGRLIGYPAAVVQYQVINDQLRRCQFTDGSAIGDCGANSTILDDVEDLQVRYVVAQVSDDGSTVNEFLVNNPAFLEDEYTLVPGAGDSMRKKAEDGNPVLRFVAIEIGVVVRAQNPNAGYAQRGSRPQLFNRIAIAGSDSFRRTTTVFRVAVPNVLAFSQ